MVLHEERGVREDFGERLLELGERELVGMEGIGPGFLARFCVVKPVRRRDDELATVRQQPAGFGEQRAPVVEMLDELEGGNEVERSVWQIDVRGVALEEFEVSCVVVLTGVRDRIGRNVDAGDTRRSLGKRGRAITGAASE